MPRPIALFKYLLLMLFLQATAVLHAQSSHAGRNGLGKRYLDFLKPDPRQHNTYGMLSYSLMFTNQGRVMHGGRGTYPSLGFNVARLFSKQIYLGVNVELKFWKGLWGDHFSSPYSFDFNNNFHNSLTDPVDSTKAEVLKAAVNNNTTGINNFNGFKKRGTYYSAIGIAFAPFPDRYGSFMLIVKRSGFGIPVHGTFGMLFNENGPDWVGIYVPCKYNIELICKPFTCSKHPFAIDDPQRNFMISIYYKQLSWKDADFYGLPFNQVLSASFLDKYAVENYIGISLKVGMY